jgi:hypothetical protein
MPCIQKLKDELRSKKVSEEVISELFRGYEELTDHCSKKEKYQVFARVMERMDQLMPAEARQSLLAGCACCLGGSREKKVKEFVKSIEGKALSLGEKVEALRESGLFGFPQMLADGTITDGIHYPAVKGGWQCACPNFHKEKQKETISLTYCYCCAGHFRHHLQKALCVKLKTPKVLSSPLESMGREPCEFIFEVEG